MCGHLNEEKMAKHALSSHLCIRKYAHLIWGLCEGGVSLSCLYAPITYKKINMARIAISSPQIVDPTTPISGVSVQSGSNGRYTTGSQGMSQHPLTPGRERGDYDLAARVRSSQAYISAYQLFSQETNTIWLTRLEMIPTSVDDANYTWFDDQGWSNASADKDDANYQYCMEQIASLVADYQQWKNSLATTQANQFAQAGVNSAITGQGLSSSQVPYSGVFSNPSSLQSTSALPFMIETAQFILDGVNGLSSVAQGFIQLRQNKKNFDLSKKQFSSELWKYFRENGIIVHGFDPRGEYSLEDLFNGNFTYSDHAGETIETTAILKNLITSKKYAPLFQSLFASHPELIPTSGLSRSKDDESFVIGGIQFPTFNTDSATSKFADLQLEFFMTDLEFEMLQNQYNSNITHSESEIKNYESQLKDIEHKRADLLYKFINQLSTSKDEEDKLLLTKFLLGLNKDDIKLLNISAGFAATEKSLGVLGVLLNLLKGGK